MRKAKRAAARRGRRLRILFADEARFGRINRPRPCWAPIGIRPEVASQLIREYIYLYGAVSPKDGTCVYLIMPRSDTACFQTFLNVLSRKFARQDILLVLDGAPNHRCSDLLLPNNISLLFLPPYSPELNPKENLWGEIREKFLKNYALKSIDAVRTKLKQAILYIERKSKNRQIHHLIPLHPKVILMWKCIRSTSCVIWTRGDRKESEWYHLNYNGRIVVIGPASAMSGITPAAPCLACQCGLDWCDEHPSTCKRNSTLRDLETMSRLES